MNRKLAALTDAFLQLASREPLLTLSEGLIKIRAAEAALSLGWTIQEGAGTSPTGPVADYAALRNGVITWERGDRRLQLPEGSSDLAVVEPFEMFLEIKARPDYGTKAQAQFQEMDADVARISHYTQCALLFVFDPKIYLSFSGEKREVRGRPAVANAWFIRTFPPLDAVVQAHSLDVKGFRDGARLDMTFRAIPFVGGTSRVVVLGSRQDASF
jgi:hypothetical protein